MRLPVMLAAACACLALAVPLAGSVSSCIGPVGIGDTCSSNTDCEPPLQQPTGETVSVVCALGRCHYQCPSSSFCGVGSECVEIAMTAVCTLPSESTCPCPAGLQCGPDMLCHTACPPNTCVPLTQTCMAGACIDNPVADADGGPDASRD